jgi:pimeloyl-ACP methyl ester carboxylesterase
MIDYLRTPDDRFADLPGYAYRPHYFDDLRGCQGLRMHYLDEGPADAAEVFLCLHGEPTWSYLYRRMLPVFVEAGARVVAPDFYGFGRSDKPAEDGAYSFDFHRGSLLALIEKLDLRHVTLVCQDWGGLLGLTVPMDMPERFDRLLVMNTALATGEKALPPGWESWRNYCAATPDLAVGRLLGRACPHLSEAERAAYDAPFPDPRHKAGVRSFPPLVPDRYDAPGAATSRKARDWWKSSWKGQSFMAIGMADPVIGAPGMRELHGWIRNCPPPMEVAEAGHFVQEWGEPIARAALSSFGSGRG